MIDKDCNNVINIFDKHKQGKLSECDEKIVKNEDGFYYVCFKKNGNGHHINQEALLQTLKKCYYVVKVLVISSQETYINNYKVPAEKILEFFEPYIKGEKQGQIIEIDKHYNEEPA